MGRFSDAYFDKDVFNAIGSGPRGDKRIVCGMAVVALAILLLGAASYVNLAAARTLRRHREIGLRKMLGAGAGHIIGKFFLESLIISFLAAAAGMLLAWLLFPLYSGLIGRDPEAVFTPGAVAAGMASGGLVGLITGIYPAWIAFKVDAAQALSGRIGAVARGLWLQRILTVSQFAAAMTLTGLALTVGWQANHSLKLAPGFDAASLVVVDLPGDFLSPAANAFRQALERMPEVSGVAATSYAAGRDRWAMSALFNRIGHGPASLGINKVSPEFFDVYGMRPLAGRFFDAEADFRAAADVAVIDTNALAALGFGSPQAASGQMLAYMDNGKARMLKIIGIASPIRYQSAREAPEPMIFVPASGKDSWKTQPRILSVHTQGNPAAALHAIENAWQQYFPNDVPQIKTANSFFSLNYEADISLAEVLAASSALAVIISAFGIYALSSHNMQRRMREIMLRRLYGAGSGDIVRLMGREFIILIAIGAVIGLPVSAMLSERYLSGFVERAHVGYWGMAMALAIAGAVALAATLHHTVAAMRIIPSVTYSNKQQA